MVNNNTTNNKESFVCEKETCHVILSVVSHELFTTINYYGVLKFL